MSSGKPVLVNIAAIKHADDKEKLVSPGCSNEVSRRAAEREEENERGREKKNCIIHNSFPANVSVTRKRAIAEQRKPRLRSVIQRRVVKTFTECSERARRNLRIDVFPIKVIVSSLM